MFDDTPIERESMEFDVVIVGAGGAGLCAAIRLKQMEAETGKEVSVVVVEKGSEVGAHVLSGAVLDPRALDELLPDWRDDEACPIDTPVTAERFLYLGHSGSLPLPNPLLPKMVKNHGCYVVSMANTCRWLAEKAEAMGVEIYPMMAASRLIEEDGQVRGVIVGEVGIGRDGKPKDAYEPGMELRGKYTLLAEGVRGSLGKEAIEKYELDKDSDVQKYGIGIKELWKVPDDNFQRGLVQHTFGWPLTDDVGGGSWMYHFGDNYVSIGLVVHLNYKNPYVAPYQEFQRFTTHPEIRGFLEGGERVAYGARAINEGGFQSVPKLAFPGGALIGCDAGFVNVPRIKGNHNAMKTGMMAAEAAFRAVTDAAETGQDAPAVLDEYENLYENSWVRDELYKVRNAKPLWSKHGTLLGALTLTGPELWICQLTGGRSPYGTLSHGKTDAEATEPASQHKPIDYPKPDGVLTFDKLTSVSYSFTNHEEDQPSHLKLRDPSVPYEVELPEYAGPSSRYCPAGVYEYVEAEGKTDQRGEGDHSTGLLFQINAQNCVHCKTCDIKDPAQNIVWTTPEGGGGPNYPNM